MTGKIKKYLKFHLIDKNPLIKEAYWEYSEEHKGTDLKSRFIRLKKLLALHALFKDKHITDLENYKKLSPQELAELLLEYDIISFDIFDTLIFRNVYRPTDVFLFMETRYQMPYFQELRIKAEQKARSKACGGEATLNNIYHEMAGCSEIDIELWMRRELDIEQELCVINPYMKTVIDIIQGQGKKIIAVSDMYLPREEIECLLESLGFPKFDDIFVSCEHGISKAQGGLYTYVDENTSSAHKIHIGDNWASDVIMAKKAGWSVYYYPNVNQFAGIGNLPYSSSALAGNVAKGIINRYLNCGAYHMSDYFKYGFLNGGLLTCGFCKWLNEIVKENQVDKLLFVARDGFIIQKVYESYYNEISHDYVLFSRFCAQQILFDKYTDRYIHDMFRTRSELENHISIETAFREAGLDFLIERIEKSGLNPQSLLTQSTLEHVAAFIYHEKSTISQEFTKVQELALGYYKEIIGEAKNVMLVDVGWSGTCGMALKYLLEEKYNTGIKVKCALIGTSDSPMVEARIAEKTLYAYVFSPYHNRDLLEWHMNHQMTVHNILLEIIFTAPQPSFLKFNRDIEGNIQFDYSYGETENYETINEMQQGILKFAALWNELPEKIRNIAPINGTDAYAAFCYTAERCKDCYQLLKDYKISQLSGNFGKRTIRTIGEIMFENKYI